MGNKKCPTCGIASQPKVPAPIKTAPRDGTTILAYHTIHGWIEARFIPGEWSTTMDGDDYSGAVWCLGDDIGQEEVEEWPDTQFDEGGYHDGSITHWLPKIPAPTAHEATDGK